MRDSRFPFCLPLFLLVAFASSRASAQIRPGDAGFLMIAKAGNFGTLCRGFSCTAVNASVSRGETVSLELRGKFNGPFVLAFSSSANLCISIPPLFQSLSLSFPILLMVPGVMNVQDRIRACPGGIGRLNLAIPLFLPPKSKFSMQGIVSSFGKTGPALAFTQALLVTVN